MPARRTPRKDYSVPAAVIQPRSIHCRSSPFSGSANGMLSADSAEISAVWAARQAVLPQRQSFGQQRPSPQHFHPLEQQDLPQQSPPRSQMLERQQRRKSGSMHREKPLIVQQVESPEHVVPPQLSPPPSLDRHRPPRQLNPRQQSHLLEQEASVRPQHRSPLRSQAPGSASQTTLRSG